MADTSWRPEDGGPMPAYERWGKRKRIKPRKLRPVSKYRCRNHSHQKACPCGYCPGCCRTVCVDPRQRASSACSLCAFCLACKRQFPFEELTVNGVDLCRACQETR